MKNRIAAVAVDWVLTLVGALVLAMVLRLFVVQSYKIISRSMETTMLVGDYLLVNKLAYGLQNPFGGYLFAWSKPQHGDIVVFDFPENENDDYVKRVVGLPGDVIEMRNKQLYRNSQPIFESYIQNIVPQYILSVDNMEPLTVSAGQIFVMGDNRDNSSDSRIWGTVPINMIEGRAWRIYWSWDSDYGLRPERLLSKYE